MFQWMLHYILTDPDPAAIQKIAYARQDKFISFYMAQLWQLQNPVMRFDR
jgi:hypothetical protein